MSYREICYRTDEGTRWYRTIWGMLYEFDYYMPWVGINGERHPGKSIVSKWVPEVGDWVTVRTSVIY